MRSCRLRKMTKKGPGLASSDLTQSLGGKKQATPQAGPCVLL
jgi:hypothetical protein